MDEAAPLEREAEQQILKAWQELEHEAAAKQRVRHLPDASDKINDEEEEEEEEGGDDLFLALEEDNDVVLHTRLAAQAEDGGSDHEQDEEEVEETCENGQGQTTVQHPPDLPIKEEEEEVMSQPNRSSRTTSESIRTFELEKSKNQHPRSNKTQPNPKCKKPAHKRAESVENAMFGLLPLLPTTMNNVSGPQTQPIHIPNNQNPPKEQPMNNLTNVMSSKNQMMFESPLLATNQLRN